MPYNFESLSPLDFEALALDIVGKHLDITFEAFGQGPDDGIDGRFARGDHTAILQAKHYRQSGFSALLSRMHKERKKIDKLAPSRYILVTSVSISPKQKRKLAKVLGPYLRISSDILGCDDLNLLLRRYPEIEKSHFKLWLSSSTMLERILHSDIYAYQRIFRADIKQAIRVYVENESLTDAHRLLEQNHVIVISGPPGVGKTTLGEMLAHIYLCQDWQVLGLRNLTDGLKMFDKSRKQVFFFDDFLGQIALDRSALSSSDSILRQFIRLVQRRDLDVRFILTTRTYVLEAAQSISEHIADDYIDLSKFHIDVGIYTRRIRAHILYNHLYTHRTPRAFINALISRRGVTEIIDHPNYTPRIIEWMTTSIISSSSSPDSYPKDFLTTLDNPSRMWETAFRFHIPSMCRHLLYSLFLMSRNSVALEDLRGPFDRLHIVLSTKYNQPTEPMDFSDALRILEGSFISISKSTASFINPSVRDFLSRYLVDKRLLDDLADESAIPTVRWANTLYDQFSKSGKISTERRANFLGKFIPLSRRLEQIPVRRATEPVCHYVYVIDLDHIERIDVLLSWWLDSQIGEFLTVARSIATSCANECSFFSHSEQLIDLLNRLEDECSEHCDSELIDLKERIRNLLIELIERDCWMPDDLQVCCRLAEKYSQYLGQSIFDSLEQWVQYIFDDIASRLGDFSRSELEEYCESIQDLHDSFYLIGVDKFVSHVEQIMDDPKNGRSAVESSIDIRQTVRSKSQISDREINNLFYTLVEGR